MQPTDLSLEEAAAALSRRELSAVELTKAALARIEESDRELHAFLRVDADGALRSAQEADQRRSSGTSRGVLDGVPLALKDNIATQGLVTTAGSKMLERYAPPSDATVTAKLRAAGASIIGKVNLDEFAMGSSTESSAFGVTRNPVDPTRTPGGSSGGAAAAVAARQVAGALGSDTGGSIRQPAAFTGTVGLKPTYGRVSRSGVVAYASSLDQVGPMARTVRDCAVLLQAISGFDQRDSTSADQPVPDFLAGIEDGVKGLRIGVPREYFVPGMDGEVEASVRRSAETLAALGAQVVDVSLPHTKYALAAYYVIAPSEASSNLGRYDGVRYGHRAEKAESLMQLYCDSRTEGFGAEVRRRIMLGTFALSAGYYDAFYGKAQRVRTLIRRDFEQAFQSCDVILSATSPVPAWKLGEKLNDPMAMYLMDVLTLPCNLAGIPGISVPAGFTSSPRLPLGAQLLGRWWEEATVLRVARTLEREVRHAS